jgi:hypothetical protein
MYGARQLDMGSVSSVLSALMEAGSSKHISKCQIIQHGQPENVTAGGNGRVMVGDKWLEAMTEIQR